MFRPFSLIAITAVIAFTYADISYAQVGDSIRDRTKAQLRAQALRQAAGNRRSVYRSYRPPVYYRPNYYPQNYYPTNPYYGGGYYGYPGYGNYLPYYRYQVSPGSGSVDSNYFGNPHASQYFPR
ncbi:hypothetical protein Pla22_45960 [Rubripirellula amarantea]|uniref:Uncharacterized protein n=1 Tax=Rubripirellula amarantea TaxID=2527999 RepID=A0A5C5WFG8_9BACT|nr:hypothetical protein [Rubripirellula amarantea]TWT49400.1 hypothetical protein Pla22_45960 [Rubripirellula amarantea]